MEEHSPVDITIRNVPVRLNETSVGAEMNGDSVKSLFVPASSESDTQVTHFNEEFENKSSPNSADISEEFNEKLRISQNASDNCGLINGCNTFLQDDMKCVHISVNGIKRCKDYELINAHIDQLTRTCADHSLDAAEINRTEESVKASQTPVNSVEHSLSVENSLTENFLCNDTITNKSEITNSKPVSNVSPDPGVHEDVDITYLGYDSESQMPDIMRLIQKDLSEPYSIYTYRYFIHNWPKLCFLVGNRVHC